MIDVSGFRKFLEGRPPTQSDSYQRLYWHILSLRIMSTMSSKHVES